MIENIEFLKRLTEIDGVVAGVITGVFTFFITKYTYHKNIPLDKYEMAYDKVYYPIYCLLKSEKNRETIIIESEKYLNDNTKYVDRSTLKAFRYLKESGEKQKKKAYDNFMNNVYSLDTKIRRRLGYLEPNVFALYTYSNPTEKRALRMIVEIVVGYILLVSMSIIDNQKWNTICASLSILFLVAIVIEIFVLIVTNIFKLIGKGGVFLSNIVLKGLDKLKTVYKKRKNKNIHKRRKK